MQNRLDKGGRKQNNVYGGFGSLPNNFSNKDKKHDDIDLQTLIAIGLFIVSIIVFLGFSWILGMILLGLSGYFSVRAYVKTESELSQNMVLWVMILAVSYVLYILWDITNTWLWSIMLK